MILNLKMNTFVTIKHIETYRKVIYYSICYEGEEESIFEKFLIKYNDSNVHEELLDILEWMQRIGDDIGANTRYFRHEGAGSDAKALPPPSVRYIEGEPGQLRLYCMVFNPLIVFLFSGGIKTTQKATACPNVSHHFRLANTLTKALTIAHQERDIELNQYEDDIEVEDSFELMI